MKRSPLLIVEFNELCPELINDLIAKGSLPNFRALRDASQAFTTDAEESGENLNPWVQWATVHTGLSADEHGIETLSEGDKVAGRNIWDILSREGRSSWICGSMNASYDEAFRGYLLPDPWSTGANPYPADSLQVFFEFVRSAVQEHSNAGGGITAKSAKRFLTFMMRHGLSAATVVGLVRQLASERFAETKWRRAAMMDLLQLDLFRNVWKKIRPNFATFFLNSTAHFQHCYWRHFEPESFSVHPPESELRTYGDAIPYGYRAMDTLLGKLLRIVGDDCSIVFCTGLSQQPYLKFEASGGRNYYRLRSAQMLRERLALDIPYDFEPVMAEQFYLRLADEASANAAADHLETYRVQLPGDPTKLDSAAFSIVRRGDSLLVQCNCTQHLPPEAALVRSGKTTPFFDVFYRLEALKSGCHHPDGVLWVKSAGLKGQRHAEKVSIRAIAPTVLHLLGVTAPEYMTHPALPAVTGERPVPMIASSSA